MPWLSAGQDDRLPTGIVMGHMKKVRTVAIKLAAISQERHFLQPSMQSPHQRRDIKEITQLAAKNNED